MSLTSPKPSEVESAFREFRGLSNDELINRVFPRTEDIFLDGGYSGENPLDAIKRWYRETFVPTCKRVGEEGAHVLAVIADPASAADLAIVKLVSDFLIDHTNVAEAPEMKLVIGIALIVTYCARLGDGEDVGPPT